MATAVRDEIIRIDKLELGPYGTNAYIIVCLKTRASVLVDAPAEADTLLDALKDTSPSCILLTHNHFDHTGALTGLRSNLGVPLGAHILDSKNLPSPPQILLEDGDNISFGDIKLQVMHTPGHTPGSLCFRTGKYLLSGDTIFPGGPGRTGSPESFRQIVSSITEKIFYLPDDTRIFPGHGKDTVLKQEKEEFAAFTSRAHSPSLCGDVLWLSS